MVRWCGGDGEGPRTKGLASVAGEPVDIDAGVGQRQHEQKYRREDAHPRAPRQEQRRTQPVPVLGVVKPGKSADERSAWREARVRAGPRGRASA